MIMIQDDPMPTGSDKPLRITGDPYKVQVRLFNNIKAPIYPINLQLPLVDGGDDAIGGCGYEAPPSLIRKSTFFFSIRRSQTYGIKLSGQKYCRH